MPRFDSEFDFELCLYGSDYFFSGEFTAEVVHNEVGDVWITRMLLTTCDGDVVLESDGERHNYEVKTIEGFVYDYARHLILRDMRDTIIEGAK